MCTVNIMLMQKEIKVRPAEEEAFPVALINCHDWLNLKEVLRNKIFSSQAIQFTENSQPKLSTTLKFPVANKPRNSQLKLCPNPKFPVADKDQDQPKFSPTRKFVVLNFEELFSSNCGPKYWLFFNLHQNQLIFPCIWQ